MKCKKLYLVRFEPVTSRSEIGTSHVTDGWKLSFILNFIVNIWTRFLAQGPRDHNVQLVDLRGYDLLDFDFGIMISRSFHSSDFGTRSVPRVTNTIRVGYIGNFVFNQCWNFPRWTKFFDKSTVRRSWMRRIGRINWYLLSKIAIFINKFHMWTGLDPSDRPGIIIGQRWK